MISSMKRFFDYWIKSRFLSDCKESPNSLHEVLKQIALYGSLFICFLSLAWPTVSNHVTPMSDFAADMLLANNISEKGYLLVGHYSRWGFNHPGPFWFYFNYLIEYAFGWAFSSRFQSWQFGSILTNTFFIGFSAISLSRFLLGQFCFRYAIVFCMLLIGFVGSEITSIWMPFRLIAPYLAFIVCVLHVMNGNFRYTIPSILFSGILIHGYATMPILTLPMLLVGILIGWIQNRNFDGSRKYLREFFISGLIAFIFLAPMVLDFFLSDSPNILKLIDTSKSFSGMEKPSWGAMSVFILDLLFKDHPIGWLLSTLFLALLLPLLNIPSESIRKYNLAAILILTIASLSILYYKGTPAPIFPFVAYYLKSLPPLLLATVLAPIFLRALKSENKITFNQQITTATPIIFSLIAFATAINIAPKPDSGKEVENFANAIMLNSKTNKIAIDYTEYMQWPFVAGLLLELDRLGKDSCTTWTHMGFLYTQNHICNPETFPNFVVVESKSCEGKCFYASGNFGLKRYAPHYIKSGEIISFNQENILFSNWYASESTHRWSSGNLSSIAFKIDTTQKFEGILKLHVGTLGKQEITISINGTEIYSGVVDASEGILNVPFDKTLLRDGDGTNTLAFELPDARKPGNADQRILALALKSFQIR